MENNVEELAEEEVPELVRELAGQYEDVVDEGSLTMENGEVSEAEDLLVVEPCSGMSFSCADEVERCLQRYARSVGFAFVKYSSKNDSDGQLCYRLFACHRSGTRKMPVSNVQRTKKVGRVNCPVRVAASRLIDRRWELTSVKLEHNHEMSPDNARFIAQHRKPMPNVRRRKIEFWDKAGVRPNKFVRAMTELVGGSENMPCLLKDCRTHMDEAQRGKMKEVDANAVYKLFIRMQKVSRDFFFEIEEDEEGRMKNVLWIDARSRAAYKEFNDVITLDTTYLVKKYKMPFVSFVGVNHHGHSILLGCALLGNEDVETFEWLFSSWLRAMGGRVPNAIITDQCSSIEKAIGNIFPQASHRWCLWHILYKFPDKVGGMRRYSKLLEDFKDAIYESLSLEEFEEKWGKLVREYGLEEMEWFDDLYRARSKWVPVYVRDQFWAGMSSLQRSESMHAYFDGYVDQRTSLTTFVERYEIALGDKIEKEAQADAECMHRDIICRTRLAMEAQFQRVYTHNIFLKVQEEISAMIYCEVDLITTIGDIEVYEVTETEDLSGGGSRIRKYKAERDTKTDEVNCSCRMFNWKGLLCRHVYRVFRRVGISVVPNVYVIRRWRKDVNRPHSKIKLVGVGGKWSREMERQKKLEKLFYKAVDTAIDSEDKCQFLEKVIGKACRKLDEGTSEEDRGSSDIDEKAAKQVR